MKKLVFLAGLAVAILVTGCGGTQPTETTKSNVKGIVIEEIHVESIEVEEIQIEETLIEETLTERVYLDDEYQSELDYNSKVNTWDNSSTITRWT